MAGRYTNLSVGITCSVSVRNGAQFNAVATLRRAVNDLVLGAIPKAHGLADVVCVVVPGGIPKVLLETLPTGACGGTRHHAVYAGLKAGIVNQVLEELCRSLPGTRSDVDAEPLDLRYLDLVADLDSGQADGSGAPQREPAARMTSGK